jgi:predicted metal-dependent HD superfamily phosphohydrolase
MHGQGGNTITYATHGRWLELWSAQADNPALEHVYDDLVERYGEPHRHYHTLRHISRCLGELDGVRGQAGHPFEVELALWLHDAVYDPARSDNEEASATYAREALGGLLRGEQLELVRSLIMATRHAEPPRTSDEGLIADIDLAILGSPAEEYREYEDDIRREYSRVPEDRFRAGRAQVLARFLARRHIYHTGHFRERYEENARANLSRSVSALRSGH